MSRGQIDDYTKFVSKLGAKGLAYIKINDVKDLENGIQSPILKFLNKKTIQNIFKTLEVKTDDLIFFGAGSESVVNLSMSSLIKKLGHDLDLYVSKWAPCWIVNFPMFELNAEGSLTPLHHPFTLPKASKKELLENPNDVLAYAYDVVLNGYEIGGGSLRIYDKNMQEAIFEILNISKKEAESKFGFLLKALSSGCPPHGGIAFGLDRIVMLRQDASRGKVWTKVIREITVAAKDGPDPNDNPRLRLALEKANAANMPKDTIKRAIEKGSGTGETGELEEIIFEGYGPGGVAILVETMTDNRNRTVSDVRHAFSKFGGNLGTDGSVSYLFKNFSMGD